MASPGLSGNLTFGGTITINIGWSGVNSKCTYAKVTYNFEGTTGTINAKVPRSTSSITWTIPSSWASKIPNSSSGTLKITSTKYDNSNFCWSSGSSTRSVGIPSSMYPSIDNVSLSESVSKVSTSGYGYLQNLSKINLSVTASGKYSATISAYKIIINGVTYTTSSLTTGALKTAGTNTWQVTVRDSRGKTKTTSGSFKVLEYEKPKITNFTIARCNQSGTLTDEGTYVKVVSGASVNPCNNGTTDQNTKAFKLSYKLSTSENWTEITLPNSSYNLADTRIISGFDIDNTYNFKIEATDTFDTASKVLTLESSDNIMDFLANGKGMAIGKASEYEDTLDVGYTNTYLSKNTYIGGNGILDIEKNIFFRNTGDGQYTHDIKIYGGNGTSFVSLGIWDYINNHRVVHYRQSNETIYLDSNVKLSGFRHVITAHTTTDQSISSSDTITINLETAIKSGDKLSLSNGKILIGSGIAHVKVSAGIYFTSSYQDGDKVHLNVRKNDSVVASVIANVTGNYFTVDLPSKLIAVSEGDLISLTARNQTRIAGGIGSNNNATFLTVEAVD